VTKHASTFVANNKTCIAFNIGYDKKRIDSIVITNLTICHIIGRDTQSLIPLLLAVQEHLLNCSIVF